jgi:hypothetical protein
LVSILKEIGNSVLVHVTDTVRMHVSETMVPNDSKGLTDQVISLSGSCTMEVALAGSKEYYGRGSVAGEVHGMYLAQQVKGGGDQGGLVRATID